MQDVEGSVNAAEAVADSQPMGWLARIGLTARGCVYLIMGLLAVLLALGGHQHVDQRGALTELIAQPFGSLLVFLLALGFAAYAVWRFSEALFGVPGEGDKAGPRVKSFARGLAYAVLAVTALSVLQGARSTQAGQQGHLARDVMSHTGGRWLVGLVGVGIIVVAVTMIHEGWSKKFLRYFGSLPAHTRRWVVELGRAGTVARGLVFAITGFLVIVAAWTASPKKAGGVDAGLQDAARPAVRHGPRARPRSGAHALRRLRPRRGRVATRPWERVVNDSATSRPDSKTRGGVALRLCIGAVLIWGLIAAIGTILVHWADPSWVTRADTRVSTWFFHHRTDSLHTLTHFGSLLTETTTAIAVTAVAFFLLRWWLGRWRESVTLLVSISGELLIFVMVTAGRPTGPSRRPSPRRRPTHLQLPLRPHRCCRRRLRVPGRDLLPQHPRPLARRRRGDAALVRARWWWRPHASTAACTSPPMSCRVPSAASLWLAMTLHTLLPRERRLRSEEGAPAQVHDPDGAVLA